MTYEEYLKMNVKYPPDTICGMPDCKKPGLYEGGDMRCWFPMCEEHARMKQQYELDMLPLDRPEMKDVKERLEKRLKELKDAKDRTRE